MIGLVTAIVFIVVSLVIVAGFYAATADTPVQRRLNVMMPGGEALSVRRSTAPPRPNVFRRLLAVLGRFSLAGSEGSLTESLSAAGIRSPNATAIFLGTRTLVSFGPALVIIITQISAGRKPTTSLLIAVGFWIFGHVMMNLWLRRRVSWRVRRITEELPDTLDLMVVCLEAGLGLNPTIARVGEERAKLNDPLGAEFAQISLELRSGRTREESLRGLGNRNGVEDLKALSGLIIQSDRLGASMAKTLRAHADLLRTKRRQRAEEAARKLPIKMLLPLALFILPALFVVAVGPAMLSLKVLFRTLTRG